MKSSFEMILLLIVISCLDINAQENGRYLKLSEVKIINKEFLNVLDSTNIIVNKIQTNVPINCYIILAAAFSKFYLRVHYSERNPRIDDMSLTYGYFKYKGRAFFISIDRNWPKTKKYGDFFKKTNNYVCVIFTKEVYRYSELISDKIPSWDYKYINKKISERTMYDYDPFCP